MASVEDAVAAWKDDCACLWLDVFEPSETAMSALADAFAFADESVSDTLSGEQRSRTDDYDDYAMILLYGAVSPDDEARFAPRKICLFYAPKYLIAVHDEPLRTLNQIGARMNKRPAALLQRGAQHLLFAVVDSIADNYLVVAENCQNRLDTLEELSLSPQSSAELLSRVIELRQELLELRRNAIAMRDALQPILSGDLDYLSEDMSRNFQHVRDHLTQAVETVDNLRELLHGVRDNYHANSAERANAIMMVLTIFASLFLPLSLVAGIYGMNVVLWPPVDQPASFWYVMGAMGLIVVAMLGFFRWNRWF